MSLRINIATPTYVFLNCEWPRIELKAKDLHTWEDADPNPADGEDEKLSHKLTEIDKVVSARIQRPR